MKCFILVLGIIIIGVITSFLGINVMTETGINLEATILIMALGAIWYIIVNAFYKT